MDTAVDIIEPCGFPFSDRSLRRAGMDYLDHIDLTRHMDWDAFHASAKSMKARVILFSSKASRGFHDFTFADNDILLFGSESAGVPDHVRFACDDAVTIPMANNMRSLNLAVSAGMALSEALRQTRQIPQ